MAKNKKKPLNDEAVLSYVEGRVRQGIGFETSKLSTERERVLKYYNSTLPLQQNTGRSSYRSTDVYDSVESMKAQLLETFAGNPDNLVSFPPQSEEDVESCKECTEATNEQVFERNEGYSIFHDAIHDGLTSRIGVTKVFWEDSHEDVEETFQGLSETDALALANSEDVVEFEAEEVQEGAGVFSGTLTRRVDTSHVCLTPVPPEEFVVSQSTTKLDKASMVCHRTLKGKWELIEEGYPKEKVDEINWADVRSTDLTPEKIERETTVSDSAPAAEEEEQEETEKVMLYETYIRMDMRDGRGVKLWKICHAGRVLLEKEEVDRAPFKVFVPLPIPHILHGNNFASRVIPYQNARTVLTRAILDHASVTTNPRWGVVKGGLLNPKEMQDNRLGGLVNLNRPDAIFPLEQQNLNPFVFQTLETLKANKEESTGISSLSQGLNKDAVSNQNSQGLVQDLVSLSQGRQKIIARNFAYGYLVPLYLEVYRLLLENKKGDLDVRVDGQYKKVTVAQWIKRETCRVALHLGYGERDKQAAKIAQAFTMITRDAANAPLFQLPHRHAMLMDGLRMAGLENYGKYLGRPEQAPPQQPDPLKVAEVKAKTDTAEAAKITASTKAETEHRKLALAVVDAQQEQADQQLDAHLKVREADRQDADVANRIDVSQREMTLLENAPAESTNNIASPNS